MSTNLFLCKCVLLYSTEFSEFHNGTDYKRDKTKAMQKLSVLKYNQCKTISRYYLKIFKIVIALGGNVY